MEVENKWVGFITRGIKQTSKNFIVTASFMYFSAYMII